MNYVSLEDLIDKVDSKFRLVIIAAKRSRQLNEGATPLVQAKAYKPTYTALEELKTGRVEYSTKSLEEVTKAGIPSEAVKPTWFREIAPEEVTAEEETEEEGAEVEAVPPVETEEEAEGVVPPEAEGEIVDLAELEKGEVEEEAG